MVAREMANAIVQTGVTGSGHDRSFFVPTHKYHAPAVVCLAPAPRPHAPKRPVCLSGIPGGWMTLTKPGTTLVGARLFFRPCARTVQGKEASHA